MGPARGRRSPRAGAAIGPRPFHRQRNIVSGWLWDPKKSFPRGVGGLGLMATKPVAKAAMEARLMAMAPRQGELLPDGRQAGVVYTGKPGRPRGRKNNSTLMLEQGIAQLGDEMLRQTVHSALSDPIAEAKRMVAQIYQLPEDADPNTIVHRREGKDGVEMQIVTFADEVQAFALKLIDDRKNARAIAMPFVQQKKPQQVDVTEKKTIMIVQARMDDDGLGDPAARAKNVTPPKDPGDGL